jgi:hypothetical protein
MHNFSGFKYSAILPQFLDLLHHKPTLSTRIKAGCEHTPVSKRAYGGSDVISRIRVEFVTEYHLARDFTAVFGPSFRM